ncbi:Clavaminate synthase-like protein [Atractiella rhizophila]|nr:Clavaminate synthase-like protein [Atractiella rhizophila]
MSSSTATFPSTERISSSLIQASRDFTPPTVREILPIDITALSFLRLVSRNFPFVIRGYLNTGIDEGLINLGKWDEKYLAGTVSDQVEVAVTPDGWADSIHTTANETQYFVEPATTKMTLSMLFAQLNQDPPSSDSPVHYLQSQDSNLTREVAFKPLFEDLKGSIAWARDAFDAEPEATNLWIGNERSTSALHSDPYENLYLVVKGMKRFTLFPPLEYINLNESIYQTARWSFNPPSTFTLVPSSPPITVPWISRLSSDISWNSINPQPYTVEVKEGDLLYLPAAWFHEVEQRGVTIAVNWWFEADWAGKGMTMRDVGRALAGRMQEEEEESS